MDDAQRPRARGFSPTATIAILVGVTATSVAGFTGLARVMYPAGTTTASVGPMALEEPPLEPTIDVAQEATSAEVLPAAEEANEMEQAPAPDTERAARPARPTQRPRPAATSPRAGESPESETDRNDIVRVSDDPLGGVDLGHLAG